jgi:hypothetical protein
LKKTSVTLKNYLGKWREGGEAQVESQEEDDGRAASQVRNSSFADEVADREIDKELNSLDDSS